MLPNSRRPVRPRRWSRDQQARKTDNRTVEIGHPGRHSFWHSEIVVERPAGIVASDRRVFVSGG
jgi:hypothetical protein